MAYPCSILVEAWKVQLNLAGRGATVALLIVVAAASQVSGNFAASPGFSGRAGVTCVACHVVQPPTDVPADAHLEGLPASWDVGKAYTLTISVTGGPTALPAPAPQGGFDLEVSAGRLVVQDGDADRLRLVGAQEATYRPAGTMQRAWSVDWVAPDLAARPGPVTVWLAVLAADGNHVVATNTSDGGERFDSTASLVATVGPSAGADAAWRALPLAAPHAAANRTADGWVLSGGHGDGNATRLLWRVDAGPWQAKDTGPTWDLALGTLRGSHTVTLRSEGNGRASPDVPVAVDDPSFLDQVTRKSTPVPALLPIAAVALAILSRRSPA